MKSNEANDGYSAVLSTAGLGAVAETCNTCRYWKQFDHEPENILGNCRRYPPVADGLQLRQAEVNGYGVDGDDYARDSPFWWGQPCVSTDEWCGEWRAPNA